MIRFDLSIDLDYKVLTPTDFVFIIQPTNTAHQRVTWERLEIEPNVAWEEQVEGNPANIVGYVNTKFHVEDVRDYPHEVGGIATSLKGVKLFNFPNIPDLRGNLTVGEFEKQIPFVPRRYFIVYGVPTAETRGEHAHVRCHQFLIALSGSINVIADDGANREEFILNRNNLGLYLPAMTWGIQYRYSRDAVLLVFASEFYDPQDYIRDYETFIAMSRAPA